MTEIDVPDWVVDLAVEAFLSSTGQAHKVTDLQRELTRECMAPALTAVMAAWMVPVMWKHERCGWTPIDECLIATNGPITYAYTFRKEPAA